MLKKIKKWFSPNSPTITDIFSGGYYGNGNVTPKSILGNPAVFRAVDLISTSVAKIPFDVFVKTDDGREAARNHPAYSLLKLKPNQFYSKFQLIKSWVVQTLTHGDGFIWINRDDLGRPVELLLLDSASVTVGIEQDRLIYAVQDSTGIHRIDSSNVLHLRGLGTDGYTGLNICQVLSEAFSLGNTLQRYTNVFFSQGSRPNLIIKLPPEINSPEQIEEFRKHFGNIHGGDVSNAFRPALIRPGMEIQPLQSDSAVEQLTNLREHDLKMISNIFGIPQHRLGSSSNSVSYGSLEQENLSWLEDLDGWICQAEMEMSIKLLRTSEHLTHYVEANTLHLVKTAQGLSYQIDLNEQDPEAMSLKAKIDRKDVTGSSATFRPTSYRWEEDVLLYDRIELVEIGPVTIPAMENSTAFSDSDNAYSLQLYETQKRIHQL